MSGNMNLGLTCRRTRAKNTLSIVQLVEVKVSKLGANILTGICLGVVRNWVRLEIVVVVRV